MKISNINKLYDILFTLGEDKLLFDALVFLSINLSIQNSDIEKSMQERELEVDFEYKDLYSSIIQYYKEKQVYIGINWFMSYTLSLQEILLDMKIINYKINKNLLNKQKDKWANLIKIQYYQNLRFQLEEIAKGLTFKIDKEKEEDILNLIYQFLYVMEQELQLSWSFVWRKSDVQWNYFKFWELPHSGQPYMDNNDNYPSWYYFFNETDLFNLEKHNEFIRLAPKFKINNIFG